MIQCPNCQNTLQDWAQTCQFCKADVTKVPRPKTAASANRPLIQTATWIWPTYYTISGYFVLSGVVEIIQTIYAASAHKAGLDGGGIGPIQIIMLVIGGITSLIGLGLIAKVEIVRGIVNVFCWIRIATGLLSLPATIGLMVILGPIGFLMLAMSIFDIISAGLMIYLIGETD